MLVVRNGSQPRTGSTANAMTRAGLQGGIAALVGLLALAAVPAHAQEATSVTITIKNHRFQPAEVRVAAGKPITLEVVNQDPTPEEFESQSLKVEKIVAGNSRATIRLFPLKPGRYGF